ncbi:unnamed protein product [Caenorhabditis angaria]|uniref:DNA primase large subunit n=1 Tax=Caenorhabditis angaria TaxID=860376 RepID=A0A9P1MV06_9PELO|nr:unnamed protein product [Caenorhabditis angaria]
MIIGGRDNRVIRSKITENRRSIKIDARKSINVNELPGYLKLYQTPPGDDISLMEFDEIAMERLKLLKSFENCKDSYRFNDQEFVNRFRKQYVELKKLIVLPKEVTFDKSREEIAECWRRDTIGHFILRLAFCRTPESQKWLTNLETDLFRFRFLHESPKNVTAAFEEMNLNIQKITKEQKMEMLEDLVDGCQIGADQVEICDFYRVEFTEALELIRRGNVHLDKGFAYFPYDDLVSIVAARFRNIMMAAMARSYKHLAILEEEGRLLPRLSRLANNVYDGKAYNGGDVGQNDQITRFMIDKLSTKSFPPCMKNCHVNLRREHHLKFGARRQYGLFLKAIGLSLDEAMSMMRDEFTKKIPSDKFDKEYAYNIRYMYGKEGRRVAENGMSCSSIILRNPPSAMDCHGCPFRHTEKHVLAQRLQKENFNKEQIEKIINFSENNGYDKACTRFFEFSHKLEEGALGCLITHPNQFFEESQKILNPKSEDIENEEDEEEEMEILTKEEPVEKREENENEGSSSTGSPPKLTPEPQEMMTSSMVKNGEEETPSASPTPKRKYKEREKKTTREYRVKKNRLIDHNAPKRYKSPYVQFMMQRRASYRNQKMTQGEINVAIANAWQELSAEERKPFEILAAKDKEKSKKAWKAYEKTAEFAEFQKSETKFRGEKWKKTKS